MSNDERAATKIKSSFFFGERGFTFTFAVCCRPSVCLSYVTLVHPIQAV